MSRNRTILAWGLQLVLVATVHAQSEPTPSPNPETDFIPHLGDVQIFDQAEVSDYGRHRRRRNGFFFEYNYMQWAISHPDVTDVGREGFDPLTFDGQNFSIQESTLDTGYISARLQSGSRLEFGFIDDDKGWLFSSFVLNQQVQELRASNVGISFLSPLVAGVSALESFVDATGPLGVPDGIDDDLNANHIFGRFGEDLGTPNATPPPAFVLPFDDIPDVPAPTDFGDLAFLPVYFSDVTVRNTTKAWGIEVDRLWLMPVKNRNMQWEVFGGVRYLKFRDTFLVDARGDVIVPEITPPDFIILGVLSDSRWETNAENNLVGPQIGVRWSTRRGRFGLSSEARFFAAANFQNVRQNGYIGNVPLLELPTTFAPLQPTPNSPFLPGSGRPIGLLPTGFNHEVHDTEFTPAGELRVDGTYQLFRSFALEGGFTMFFADNIARASNMVDYTLPSMGITSKNQQELVFYGFNVGISINR